MVSLPLKEAEPFRDEEPFDAEDAEEVFMAGIGTGLGLPPPEPVVDLVEDVNFPDDEADEILVMRPTIDA